MYFHINPLITYKKQTKGVGKDLMGDHGKSVGMMSNRMALRNCDFDAEIFSLIGLRESIPIPLYPCLL